MKIGKIEREMKEQTPGLNTLQGTYCRHVSVIRYDDIALAEHSSNSRTVMLTDAPSEVRPVRGQYLALTAATIGSFPAHVTSECQLNGWQEESVSLYGRQQALVPARPQPASKNGCCVSRIAFRLRTHYQNRVHLRLTQMI
jgi:hypothetical protein